MADTNDWSITVSDGVHDYVITATDAAGNVVTLNGSVTIDTTLPALTGGLQSDDVNDTGDAQDDRITNNNQPIFSGETEAGLDVTLTIIGPDDEDHTYTATVAADASGHWSIDFTDFSDIPALADGTYAYELSTIDIFGNESTLSNNITVDTQITLTASLDSDSDSGASDTDGITQESTPTFSGTGEVDANVTLIIDGKTYTTTVAADGTWSITLSEADELADGHYDYSVNTNDVAGNTQTITGSITVDNVATPINGGLDAASDTGSDNTDGLTNESTPLFSGTGAEPGATIILTISGKQYPTTVNDDGSWSIQADSATDGIKNYTLKAIDLAGNESDLKGSIQIDTVTQVTARLSASKDTGDSDSDGITNDNRPVFTGTAEAGASIVLTIGNSSFTAVADVNGDWSIDTRNTTGIFPDGDYTYEVTATDAAGNEATTGGEFTIETVDPTLTGGLDTAPESDIGVVGDYITNIQTPEFSGTGEDGNEVVLNIANNIYTTTVNNQGTWSIDVTTHIAAENHVYTLKSTDAAGNESEINGSILVDTETEVSGSLAASSDTGTDNSDQITNDPTLEFTGQGEQGAEITLTINGQAYNATVGADGSWNIAIGTALSEGDYSYTIKAEDIAGNTDSIAGEVTIDLTAPVFSGGLSAASDSGSSDSDAITNVTEPVFTGAGEAGATIELTIGGQTYTTQVQQDGTWSIYVTSTLAEGVQNYSIAATDIAGNTSTRTGDITVDSSINLAGSLSASSDTGADDSDSVTSDTTPSLNGTGDPDATVVLTIGDESYTTTVNAQGKWSLDVTDVLAEGIQAYQLQSTDIAGNTTSLSGNITIDTSTEFTVLLDAGSDSGALTNDAITNVTTPLFTGTGEPGAAINFMIDGATYNATVDDAGNWSVNVTTPLATDGDYNYTVTATDDAGNVATQTGNITVDTQIQLTANLVSTSDTGISSTDGMTKDSTPSFSGIAYAGASIQLQIGGATYTIQADTDGNWAVTADAALDDGNHTYVITATDIAGNTATETGSITVDTEAPEITGSLNAEDDSGASDSDGLTNITTPTFSGTGQFDAQVVLTIAGNSYQATVAADGSWSIDVTNGLSDGVHQYSLVATDLAGNETELNDSIVVDTTTDVSIRLDASSDTGRSDSDGVTRDNTPTFSGAGDADASIAVTINGNTYNTTVDSDGNWSLTVTDILADGDYDYSVATTDLAGNTDTATGSVTIDTATTLTATLFAGSDTGSSDSDAITQDTTPTFTGTGEQGATVVLTIDGKQYSSVVGSEGNWSINVDTEMSDGEYSYEVVATDTAGNTETVTDSINIDTQAPALSGGLDSASDSGSSATDNLTNVTQPRFSGTGEPGASISLTIGGNAYTATVDASGNWQVDVTNNLSEGAYDYDLSTTDLAGNTITLNGSITVDTSTVLTASLSDASNTGSQDGLTQLNKPVFDGTGEAGATIVLTINGESYNTVVDNDGNWSITVADAQYDY